MSQGSSDTGFFSSLEKEKRRKKLDGRVDAEAVINEIMEAVDLNKATHEDAESNDIDLDLLINWHHPMILLFLGSGLQLFVGKDGTVTFDKSSSRKDYEQVVIEGGPR